MDYQEQYGQMHAKGKYFPGYSITPYVDQIAGLVEGYKVESLLDYGCGRGLQYLKRRVHERWGGVLPHCYDIGVRGLDEKPDGQFGGVLCTDVLEHIERTDLPGVIDELIRYTESGGFLFVVISCRPTKKKLPDGRDVHVTIEPPSWWQALLTERLEVSCSPAHVQAGLIPQVAIHAAFDVAGHFDEPDQIWAVTL